MRTIWVLTVMYTFFLGSHAHPMRIGVGRLGVQAKTPFWRVIFCRIYLWLLRCGSYYCSAIASVACLLARRNMPTSVLVCGLREDNTRGFRDAGEHSR